LEVYLEKRSSTFLEKCAPPDKILATPMHWQPYLVFRGSVLPAQYCPGGCNSVNLIQNLHSTTLPQTVTHNVYVNPNMNDRVVKNPDSMPD